MSFTIKETFGMNSVHSRLSRIFSYSHGEVEPGNVK
jgi:hypothetical protein